MAAVPETDVFVMENQNDTSVKETLNLSNDEEIQSPNLQSTNGGESIEQLKENRLNEVKAERELVKEKHDEDNETQQSKLQSTDDQDSVVEKRKREEENGEAKKALHPMWKTSLCSFFRRQGAGVCSHGEGCRYAHSEEELRPRPDKSWDPTSERAKKLMKLENGEKFETVDARENVLMPDAIADSSDPTLEKCLVHLPRKWTNDNLKSFLDEQGVVYKTAKKKKGMTVGFVSFETADQVKTAIEGMDGKSFGNKHIKVADVIPRSFEMKTRVTDLVSENPDASISLDGSEDGDTVEKDDFTVLVSVPKARNVRDVVTPLAHMSYSDQMEHKKNSLAQTLKRLTRNARKACPDGVPLPGWVLNSREIGGLPCKLEGIIESPLINGYRNKCEFSVGYSIHGKQTVGFMLGNFREGVTAVEEPVDCPNVSRISCHLASIFQDFLQHSELPVWNRINNSGFWRQLTVREGRNADQSVKIESSEASISEVMVMVQVCSVGFDDETIAHEFQRMAQAFSQGASASSPPIPLTSLVVQDHKGISNAAPADAPLKSLCIPKAESTSADEAVNNAEEARIHDYISNLCFRISPTAFFQVNTLAAEKLYSLAGDWAGLGPDTLLFDVCCGTGTIGLTLAHRVGMVVGIEMNASAVSDANRNAELNNIKNCRFVCAKAEDVMGSLLKEYLNVPHKQEPSRLSESSGTEDADIRESVTAVKVELESFNHDNGDVTNLPGCPEISGDEVKEPIQKKGVSEDQNGRNDTPGQQFKNVVAIVDPPRVGLHPTVIKALRTHPSLRRLVYISCNPESLVANAIEFCTPSADKSEQGNKNNNRGWRNMSSAGLARQRTKSMPNSEPFRPVKAVAVDIFPHTPHCETVMLLERLDYRAAVREEAQPSLYKCLMKPK